MGNFASSFAESLNKTSATGAAGAADLIKEKIKLEQTKADEKYKASTLKHSNIILATKMGDDDIAKKIISIIDETGDDLETQKNIGDLIKTNIQERQKSRIKSQEEDETLKKFGINVLNGQEPQGSPLEQIQRQLPQDVSLKVGDFTITGSKVEATQKKAINDIEATQNGVNRIIGIMNSVPDLGGINFKSEGLIGKALGLLPRGLEGRARELSSKYITSGSGGGLTGLSESDETSLRSYMSSIPTYGADAYKSLSGDSGRLSDFDIERGKNLLWRPDLGETTQIRDKKAKIIQEAVQDRAKAIKNGEFKIDEETGAILTPQVLDRALAKISGGKSEPILMIDGNGNKALVDPISGKVVKEIK